ncbi:hypothetical protein Tco_1203570 [Tanacetum coccineum]
MAFRNFMNAENDEDLSFLPKEPSAENDEALCLSQLIQNLLSVDARIKDRKCKKRGGSSRPPVKQKLVQGASSTRATCAKTATSKDDSPFLTISDDDEEFDVLKERGNARDLECKELRLKCEATMIDFYNNLVVIPLHKKIGVLSSEVKDHKANLNKMLMESRKWNGYQVSLLT